MFCTQNNFVSHTRQIDLFKDHDSPNTLKNSFPSLADLARKSLNNSDYNKCSLTPIGPRTDFLASLKNRMLNWVTSSLSSGCIDYKLNEITTLIESNKSKIVDVIDKIKRNEITEENGAVHGIHFFTSRVFELKELPGFVFKIVLKNDASDELAKLKTRVESISKFREVIKERNLNHLILPQACYFNWEGMHSNCQFVVEQKLLLSSFELTQQHEIWDYCLREPAFKHLMEKIITEITILICETGLYDVCANNIPFLIDGSGLGLVDIEFTGNACKGIEGLLNMLTTEFSSIVETTAKKHLSSMLFDNINFQIIRECRNIVLNYDNLLEQYHIKKGIFYGNEKINCESIEIKPEDDCICRILINAFNDKLMKNEDSSLKAKRSFSFFLDNSIFSSLENSSLRRIDSILEKFKQNHLIFSYSKQVFFGETEYYNVQY